MLCLPQLRYDPVSDHVGEKVSKISLVDLAGSERAGKTGECHLRPYQFVVLQLVLKLTR